MSSVTDISTLVPVAAFRLGGDPRAFAEFNALRDELGKLGHPARPDVAWDEVERLCRVLLQRNGVDVQTVACLALARSHRFGVAGALEGVLLMDSVLRTHGARVWPVGNEPRREVLTWLFAQLQSLLRSLNVTGNDLPAITELENALAQLHERLDRHLQVPVVALHRLRQVVGHTGQRLRAGQACGEQPLPTAPTTALTFRRRPAAGTLCLWAVFGVVAMVSVGWGLALSGLRAGLEVSTPASAVSPAAQTSEHVARLTVFRPGSAEFVAQANSALIAALAGIKAQPGWLIVISGHTDSSGDGDANLHLSRARAAAVRDWLQRMSAIPDQCFAIQGLGDSEPIASNDTASGRMANRRVDIRRVPEEGACPRGV